VGLEFEDLGANVGVKPFEAGPAAATTMLPARPSSYGRIKAELCCSRCPVRMTLGCGHSIPGVNGTISRNRFSGLPRLFQAAQSSQLFDHTVHPCSTAVPASSARLVIAMSAHSDRCIPHAGSKQFAA